MLISDVLQSPKGENLKAKHSITDKTTDKEEEAVVKVVNGVHINVAYGIYDCQNARQ